MHKTIRFAGTSLIALGMIITAPMALAAGGQHQPNADASHMPQASQATAGHISDSQLKKFVKAKAKVNAVRAHWQGKVEQAKDKKTQAQERHKATQQMVKAVQDSGLSVSEYNRIARAAQQDKQLAQRIQQMS